MSISEVCMIPCGQECRPEIAFRPQRPGSRRKGRVKKSRWRPGKEKRQESQVAHPSLPPRGQFCSKGCSLLNKIDLEPEGACGYIISLQRRWVRKQLRLPEIVVKSRTASHTARSIPHTCTRSSVRNRRWPVGSHARDHSVTAFRFLGDHPQGSCQCVDIAYRSLARDLMRRDEPGGHLDEGWVRSEQRRPE